MRIVSDYPLLVRPLWIARAAPEQMEHPLRVVYDDPLAAARAKVVTPSRVDPTGLAGPTRGQSQGSHWRRSSRGLFVPTSVDGTVVEQRIAEAAAVLPPVGGVTGWAGLRWAGARWFGGSTGRGDSGLDVDIATCYSDIRSQPGFRVWQERLSPLELELVDGIRMTTAIRSLFFCMRYARSVRQAVRVIDLAAYSDVCSIGEAQPYALAHPGWTGVPQAREALALADENSWSPPEVDFPNDLGAGRGPPETTVQPADLRSQRAPHRHTRPPRSFESGDRRRVRRRDASRRCAPIERLHVGKSSSATTGSNRSTSSPMTWLTPGLLSNASTTRAAVLNGKPSHNDLGRWSLLPGGGRPTQSLSVASWM